MQFAQHMYGDMICQLKQLTISDIQCAYRQNLITNKHGPQAELTHFLEGD
jgi:hypothetical protein